MPELNASQFELIAEMIESKNPSKEGARLVLVEGKSNPEAYTQAGISPQSLSNTLRRHRRRHKDILRVYKNDCLINWIELASKSPTKGKEVLVLLEDGEIRTAIADKEYSGGFKVVMAGAYFCLGKVTHWALKPKTPTVKAKKES